MLAVTSSLLPLKSGSWGGDKGGGWIGGRGGSEERLFLSLILLMSERKRMEEGEIQHRCTRGFLRGLSRSGLLAVFESHRLADRQQFSTSEEEEVGEAAPAHSRQANLPGI